MAPRLPKGLLDSDPAPCSLSSFRMLLFKRSHLRPSARNPAGLPTHPGEKPKSLQWPHKAFPHLIPPAPPHPTSPQRTPSTPASPRYLHHPSSATWLLLEHCRRTQILPFPSMYISYPLSLHFLPFALITGTLCDSLMLFCLFHCKCQEGLLCLFVFAALNWVPRIVPGTYQALKKNFK